MSGLPAYNSTNKNTLGDIGLSVESCSSDNVCGTKNMIVGKPGDQRATSVLLENNEITDFWTLTNFHKDVMLAGELFIAGNVVIGDVDIEGNLTITGTFTSQGTAVGSANSALDLRNSLIASSGTFTPEVLKIDPAGNEVIFGISDPAVPGKTDIVLNNDLSIFNSTALWNVSGNDTGGGLKTVQADSESEGWTLGVIGDQAFQPVATIGANQVGTVRTTGATMGGPSIFQGKTYITHEDPDSGGSLLEIRTSIGSAGDSLLGLNGDLVQETDGTSSFLAKSVVVKTNYELSGSGLLYGQVGTEDGIATADNTWADSYIFGGAPGAQWDLVIWRPIYVGQMLTVTNQSGQNMRVNRNAGLPISVQEKTKDGAGGIAPDTDDLYSSGDTIKYVALDYNGTIEWCWLSGKGA